MKIIRLSWKAEISRDELIDLMESKRLRNAHGIMDYDELKHISGYADTWSLQRVSLSNWNYLADPKFKNKSGDFPVILFNIDGKYEVLDGKHRIGAARARGETDILAYVGVYTGK